MKRPKLVFLAVAVCLAGLLEGCGSSGHSPLSPLSVTTSSLPQGVVNVPYTATLSASGGMTPYAWSVASGSLPPGLSLSRSGVLSGTATASGSFSFSVAVSDSQQPPSVANGNYSITIAPALQVSTAFLPSGSPSVSYSATLSGTGGFPPYSWTIAQGSLPSGVTLNAASGVISGTPSSSGTSTFTVQASDSGTPAATASAGLSIVIAPPPPRNTALYVDQGNGGPPGHQWDQTGLQIQSDGSLTLLPSSPETAITGSSFGSSPTLPLLFFVGPLNGPSNLESLLVNPDYSLTSYSSAQLQGGFSSYSRPVVDPTGSNLYLPGPIDSNLTPGITIYSANGILQSVGTIALPNITNLSQIVFTPDGTLAFISTCPASGNNGSISSFSRSSNGTLTPGPVIVLPAGSCYATGLTVSPDARYLAASVAAVMVQIYSMSSDGTLTAVLPQPFAVTADSQGDPASVADMTWDQSSSFLLVSAIGPHVVFQVNSGGVAVLSFVGNTLTETVYPTGSQGIATGRILRVGPRVYAVVECHSLGCIGPFGIVGFDFQNGQLIPLSGSPYQYGNGGDMVIY
jgi:Putative Ig domain